LSVDQLRATVRLPSVGDSWQVAKADHYVMVLPLRCVECGRRWDNPVERWRVYFTDDDPPQPASYCPACARKEFGGD
jgi:hypothetical protein